MGVDLKRASCMLESSLLTAEIRVHTAYAMDRQASAY
jgi:hypothetical protein